MTVNLLLVLLISSSASILLSATRSTVDAGNWQTIRNHNENRPNLSQQLKPNHEHYVYSNIDYGGANHHPFDRSLQQQPSETENLNYGNSESSDYAMLRLRFLTEPLDSLRGQSSAIDAKIDAILDEVLPAVQQTWMSHLSVIPVQGVIPIQRSDCFGIYKGLIPNSILNDGVEDADLVIFVSAKEVLKTSSFQQIEVCGPGTLAIATSCVMDQFDRPIVGFINFCLAEISRRMQEQTEEEMSSFPQVKLSNLLIAESANDQDIVEKGVMVADSKLVATHEVGHVLGIDSELFRFFRDQESGEPLTTRPFQERVVECVDGTSKLQFFPSEATIKSEISSQGQLYYDIVTPRIQTVVRNHFDCQSLIGARLENQPTGGSCTGAHFDERLFYSELMSSIFSGTSAILSPLTLALLEDSGWYKVFYEGSQVSPFGHAAGCAFVSDDCIINDEVPAYASGSFCSRPTKVNALNGKFSADNDLLCDPTHRSIGVCDLFDRNELSLLPGFKFDPNGTRYFSDSSLQALTSQNDWCPVPSIPTGVDCTDSTGPQFPPTYVGEEYGSNSRCINFDSDGFSRTVAGCFDLQCNATSRKVVVNEKTCEFDGQRLQIQRLTGFNSKMICPKLAVVCPQLYCQGGCSGRGICNYDTNECDCFDPQDNTLICNLSVGTREPFTLPSPTTAPAPPNGSFSSSSSKCVSLAAVAVVGLFVMV